ncbi:hypothetical protein ASD64_06970 [Mesorhizobium sp. Root157]|uniref:HlyU family transcriptional regulator n=1 Tax=Mesorhizobium sp. Root157 TaxID=1736477 RepID=UPI0006FE8972|nr:HlyU family transcriptional regulator [Mesorhizobium sp. Root157]KQZ87178.1 hypothetical protein ASD64_06970 [Mesorhizobium sp. Root157]
MSFWKKLFGGGGSDEASAAAGPVKQVEHNGYTISATPFKAEGQYQTCGVITKVVDGETKEHRFIRADRFPGLDDAVEVTIRKGVQLINEQGDRIFG